MLQPAQANIHPGIGMVESAADIKHPGLVNSSLQENMLISGPGMIATSGGNSIVVSEPSGGAIGSENMMAADSVITPDSLLASDGMVNQVVLTPLSQEQRIHCPVGFE